MNYDLLIAIMFIVYAITVVFLVAMLSKKDKQFAEERKDYLNRIMAKSSQEYIKLSKKDESHPLTNAEILGDDYAGGILN